MAACVAQTMKEHKGAEQYRMGMAPYETTVEHALHSCDEHEQDHEHDEDEDIKAVSQKLASRSEKGRMRGARRPVGAFAIPGVPRRTPASIQHGYISSKMRESASVENWAQSLLSAQGLKSGLAGTSAELDVARKFPELLATAIWLHKHTAKCPNNVCGVRIWKDTGCDHMQCESCDQHFSWTAAQARTYNISKGTHVGLHGFTSALGSSHMSANCVLKTVRELSQNKSKWSLNTAQIGDLVNIHSALVNLDFGGNGDSEWLIEEIRQNVHRLIMKHLSLGTPKCVKCGKGYLNVLHKKHLECSACNHRFCFDCGATSVRDGPFRFRCVHHGVLCAPHKVGIPSIRGLAAEIVKARAAAKKDEAVSGCVLVGMEELDNVSVTMSWDLEGDVASVASLAEGVEGMDPALGDNASDGWDRMSTVSAGSTVLVDAHEANEDEHNVTRTAGIEEEEAVSIVGSLVAMGFDRESSAKAAVVSTTLQEAVDFAIAHVIDKGGDDAPGTAKDHQDAQGQGVAVTPGGTSPSWETTAMSEEEAKALREKERVQLMIAMRESEAEARMHPGMPEVADSSSLGEFPALEMMGARTLKEEIESGKDKGWGLGDAQEEDAEEGTALEEEAAQGSTEERPMYSEVVRRNTPALTSVPEPTLDDDEEDEEDGIVLLDPVSGGGDEWEKVDGDEVDVEVEANAGCGDDDGTDMKEDKCKGEDKVELPSSLASWWVGATGKPEAIGRGWLWN